MINLFYDGNNFDVEFVEGLEEQLELNRKIVKYVFSQLTKQEAESKQNRIDGEKRLKMQKKLAKMFPDGDGPTGKPSTKLLQSNLGKILPDEPKDPLIAAEDKVVPKRRRAGSFERKGGMVDESTLRAGPELAIENLAAQQDGILTRPLVRRNSNDDMDEQAEDNDAYDSDASNSDMSSS